MQFIKVIMCTSDIYIDEIFGTKLLRRQIPCTQYFFPIKNGMLVFVEKQCFLTH